MSRSDWQGCLRESRRHPRSAELLGARMSCANSAHDAAALRATCDEIRQHYPQHGYNQACAALMRAQAM